MRELFSRYETIGPVEGEARLSRREIGPSQLNSRFIKIGTDVDLTEVVVRDSEETVYIIDDSESSEYELREASYPSVYHWMLSLDY